MKGEDVMRPVKEKLLLSMPATEEDIYREKDRQVLEREREESLNL